MYLYIVVVYVLILQMKCLQYWPLKVGDVAVFGSFRVTLKSKETWPDFETNKILFTKVY